MRAESDASASSRERLRALLQRDGILYGKPDAPIRGRDGAVAPWAFYSWHVTQTGEGLELAARALLEPLRTFRSTQLASYGYTSLPLLSACVLLGGDRFTGLAIREKRKTYLAGRRIDGRPDRSRPVVVVDDSISSGTSMRAAILALESEGFEVEGGVALVTFPHRGGTEWLNGHGYRIETVFDVWEDLRMPRPAYVAVPEFVAAAPRIEPGLHPAAAARRAAAIYLSTGRVPRAPERLDAAYDARGGTFVSFRRRSDDERLARDGFWRFEPLTADPPGDVVTATVHALNGARRMLTARDLDDLKIAVTFFGPLEKIEPRLLDFDRYGIVVQSRHWPVKIGGALPNTQVYITEIEQYRHARERNARIGPYEPHDLYRHDVAKYAEPGEPWPQYGFVEDAWSEHLRSDATGDALLARAHDALAGNTPRAASGVGPHARVEGAVVTLYDERLVGYGHAWGSDLDAAVTAAARRAARDGRLASRARPAQPPAVVVTVLFDSERLGTSRWYAAKKLRRGINALHATDGAREAVVLPSALVYNGLSPAQFVAATARAAGSDASAFTSYKTIAWLGTPGGPRRLAFGFPEHGAARDDEDRRADAAMLAGYVAANATRDGTPVYRRGPVTGKVEAGGTDARRLHASYTLGLAARMFGEPRWHAAAMRGIRALAATHGRDPVGLSDCVLLAALASLSRGDDATVAALAARLTALVHADGRISPASSRLDERVDNEFLPGAAIWALTTARAHRPQLALPQLAPSLAFYRRRFAFLPSWGLAGWQMQAWGSAYALTGERAQAEFAFELADWALASQLAKNGAFLEDLCPDEPSFDTGFIAEGIAAAWSAAESAGETARAARYAASWSAAMDFLRRLIVYPEDTFCMPDGPRTVGGVRMSLTRPEIRIDAVSHCLHALLGGLAVG